MPIIQIETESIGQTGILPRIVRMVSTDSFATITGPNWIYGAINSAYNIQPSDFLFIAYEGTKSIFVPVFSGRNITLELYDAGPPLGDITIMDDNSSAGPFYPTWVKGNSGSQQVYASSTELQWNPATTTLTSPHLIANTLTSASATNLALSTPAPAANVTAPAITLTAANGHTGSSSSQGGAITLTSGNGIGSSGATGGAISITSGNGSAGSAAGTITVQAGTSTTAGGTVTIEGGAGNGGSAGGGILNLVGGPAPGSSAGGQVNITGGSASASGTGADVIVTGGASGTTLTAGNVRLRGGVATSGTQGAVIFDQGLVNFPNLSPNQLLATDASNNLISVVGPSDVPQYGVLGYSLNTNDTTFSFSSTYVPIVLNTATTSASSGNFSVNATTGEITYSGPPGVLRISAMVAGLAGAGGQNIQIAPAVNVGSGYAVYTYLAMPQIMEPINPLGVTIIALVPVVSTATFQLWVENNSGISFFQGNTIYFSVEVI